MVNDTLPGPLGNAIALHEFRTEDFTLKDWFFYTEQWFEKHNLTPNKMGFDAPYGSRGRSSIGYKYGKKRLIENNFADVTGISIMANPSVAPKNNLLAIAEAIAYLKENNRSTLVMCWSDRVQEFIKGYLESFITELNQFVSPRYGYCFQRRFAHSPTFYTVGIIGCEGEDEPSEEEEREITKWGNEFSYSDGTYKAGDLRDIYPLNILTQPHLDRDVYGQSLKDWIESSPEHGDLKKLTDTLWSWWVPKEKIQSVREELSNTGIILCMQIEDEETEIKSDDKLDLSGSNLDPFGVSHLYTK
ncbi:MAG: hypothetical protein ABFQ95_06310 [Pseudomonadota bacterium]